MCVCVCGALVGVQIIFSCNKSDILVMIEMFSHFELEHNVPRPYPETGMGGSNSLKNVRRASKDPKVEACTKTPRPLF